MEAGAGLAGTKQAQPQFDNELLDNIKGDKNTGKWYHKAFPNGVDEFRAVILGFQDQRTAWPPYDPKNQTHPICRSVDSINGFPTDNFNVEFLGKKPSEVSGLAVKAVPDADGVVRRYEAEAGGPLNCADCGLKDWETMPGMGSGSWCSPQITILYAVDVNGDGTQFVYAKQTFQRSSLPNVKDLVASFRQSETPTISKYVEVSGQLVTESNTWMIPTFAIKDDVEPDLMSIFALKYFELLDQVTNSSWLTKDRSEENDNRTLDDAEHEETAF